MEAYIAAHQTGFFVFGLCGFLLACAVFIWSFYLWWRMRRLDQHLSAFLSGSDGITLEDTIVKHAAQVTHLDKEIEELYTISNKIHQLSLSSIHKSHLIRFNPFKDLGGNQSFSLALLNGQNDGFVISFLHTREGTRIYAKNIVSGGPVASELTTEERDAIKQAMQKELAK